MMKTATKEQVMAALEEILSIDAPSNYNEASDAIDGMTDELESTFELTDEQCAEVGDVVEQWFDKGD